MIKYAANLTLLFTEWPFKDRFSAARDAGFNAVEFSFPHDISPIKIAEELRRTGLCQVLATAPVRHGTKGLAASPGRGGDFRDDVMRGLEYAIEGKSPLMHVLSGVIDPADYEMCRGIFAENMHWAVETAERYEIKIVIEAINQHALPNYFIRALADAANWTRCVQGLGLILDLYHAAKEGREPVACLKQYLRHSDHVQIAGFPGRNEPDLGNFKMAEALSFIATQTYNGWVGCEYLPSNGTLNGIGWLTKSHQFTQRG
ncbi:hydroxypyruvate isomerase [Pseudomonas sp. FW215-R2]|uniref:hydroxypyruvate isomerase family protein n=1 Tax=unclassified Pseudomonas TaxID=196821 RepID=UPI000C8863FF|nr:MULTISPECIES: TIM barrel protein [unclassified Pseudomonas]PMX03081.1 hydroxypyruvate isomerase [Pseudomonas sp. FW215-R2]PMX11954.1 hydroxypyruvate isomerase [Pseudomonas sp. FW215-L1]PMX25624.1 hydroxypyruvate isomerase [Pseudomonas sp. FW215-E1]PNA32626.1 hydroxypyruvate isomerase [Pseudomonas sp. FW215-R4]